MRMKLHMNDYLLAELGTLYTETPEDIAMEKAELGIVHI